MVVKVKLVEAWSCDDAACAGMSKRGWACLDCRIEHDLDTEYVSPDEVGSDADVCDWCGV